MPFIQPKIGYKFGLIFHSNLIIGKADWGIVNKFRLGFID